MSAWLSLSVSFIALIVSAITAWLTLFRRGQLMMTQPTVVFFGPDGSAFDSGKSKVYLRTLLYCTAKRGFVLESLFLSLQRNESKQNFNIWVYGEKGSLKRGSGLFVPQDGVTFDHHFLLPEDGADFPFLAGAYTLKIFAKAVGQQAPFELMEVKVSIGEGHAKSLCEPRTGIYFDWGPDQQTYHPHIQTRHTETPDMKNFLKLIETQRTT